MQAVTFALGSETVTTPAAVAVARALPAAPALSVTVTRSAGLNPAPRIVRGLSFTIFTVAFAAAAGAAVAMDPARTARRAARNAALPGVADEKRLNVRSYLTDLMYATMALACDTGMFPIAVVMMPDE